MNGPLHREWEDAEIRALMSRCSNWGRWGDDDELGTLNLITPTKRREASALVRSGRAVSFGRMLSTERDIVNYAPIQHKMTISRHRTYETARDWVGIECHGYAVTHLDALSHCTFEGDVYNGRKYEDVWSYRGMKWGAITAQADGIYTRGVLLDIAAVRGVEHLDPSDFVYIDDLEAAEALTGVTVSPGDALFVHTGLSRHEAETGGPLPMTERAGLHAESVGWLHDRGVAVYGGDCVERVPYPSAEFAMPLHFIGLVQMGLVMLDWPDVAKLLAVCHEEQTYEFVFSCAPLLIPRGTGSAVNPIAIF